jgi:hypothetical protein
MLQRPKIGGINGSILPSVLDSKQGTMSLCGGERFGAVGQKKKKKRKQTTEAGI